MTDETRDALKARFRALLVAARDLLRDFLAHQARRFLNLETLIATYRIPLYGYALWQMEPYATEAGITFRPEMFGWVILAVAIDRATTPLIDFFTDPVKRQAKREIAVADAKAEMQPIMAVTRSAPQKKRHARPAR